MTRLEIYTRRELVDAGYLHLQWSTHGYFTAPAAIRRWVRVVRQLKPEYWIEGWVYSFCTADLDHWDDRQSALIKARFKTVAKYEHAARAAYIAGLSYVDFFDDSLLR